MSQSVTLEETKAVLQMVSEKTKRKKRKSEKDELIIAVLENAIECIELCRKEPDWDEMEEENSENNE